MKIRILLSLSIVLAIICLISMFDRWNGDEAERFRIINQYFRVHYTPSMPAVLSVAGRIGVILTFGLIGIGFYLTRQQKREGLRAWGFLAISWGVLCLVISMRGCETQTRMTLSRIAADTRSLELAMASYRLDHNTLPTVNNDREFLKALTTPLEYISSSSAMDPYSVNDQPYHFRPLRDGALIISNGPDLRLDIPVGINTNVTSSTLLNTLKPYTYDPTNGLLSTGDVYDLQFDERNRMGLSVGLGI